MSRLEGKIALITGAAGAIGSATALLMSQEGAHVIVTDIEDESGAALCAKITTRGGRCHYVHLDVTRESDWIDAIKGLEHRLGGLDVLVNNAGVCAVASIGQTTYEQWRWQLSVDLDGKFFGCKHSLELLARSKRGSIINISSIAGTSGMAGLTAYSAAKGGVGSFSKTLALECGKARNGVRVNCVVPGGIETQIWVKMFNGGVLPPRDTVDYESIMQSARTQASQNLLGRPGQADEIAAAVVFLASDEASYVTGHELAVDGGAAIC